MLRNGSGIAQDDGYARGRIVGTLVPGYTLCSDPLYSEIMIGCSCTLDLGTIFE